MFISINGHIKGHELFALVDNPLQMQRRLNRSKAFASTAHGLTWAFMTMVIVSIVGAVIGLSNGEGDVVYAGGGFSVLYAFAAVVAAYWYASIKDTPQRVQDIITGKRRDQFVSPQHYSFIIFTPTVREMMEEDWYRHAVISFLSNPAIVDLDNMVGRLKSEESFARMHAFKSQLTLLDKIEQFLREQGGYDEEIFGKHREQLESERQNWLMSARLLEDFQILKPALTH